MVFKYKSIKSEDFRFRPLVELTWNYPSDTFWSHKPSGVLVIFNILPRILKTFLPLRNSIQHGIGNHPSKLSAMKRKVSELSVVDFPSFNKNFKFTLHLIFHPTFFGASSFSLSLFNNYETVFCHSWHFCPRSRDIYIDLNHIPFILITTQVLRKLIAKLWILEGCNESLWKGLQFFIKYY